MKTTIDSKFGPVEIEALPPDDQNRPRIMMRSQRYEKNANEDKPGVTIRGVEYGLRFWLMDYGPSLGDRGFEPQRGQDSRHESGVIQPVEGRPVDEPSYATYDSMWGHRFDRWENDKLTDAARRAFFKEFVRIAREWAASDAGQTALRSARIRGLTERVEAASKKLDEAHQALKRAQSDLDQAEFALAEAQGQTEGKIAVS